MLRFSLTCSAALLLSGCAAEAEEDEPALELTGRVVDAADILSPEFEERLGVKLSELETDTTVQLVVVTTPDLQGYDIAHYSVELARDWGIGTSEHENGVMLLVAANERRVRIEVGYGLEASVRDDEAAAIIREAIIPQFARSNYEAGLDEAVDRLIREVTPITMKEAA